MCEKVPHDRFVTDSHQSHCLIWSNIQQTWHSKLFDHSQQLKPIIQQPSTCFIISLVNKMFLRLPACDMHATSCFQAVTNMPQARSLGWIVHWGVPVCCQTLGFESCQSSVNALTTQLLTFTLPLVEMSPEGSIHIVAVHVYTWLHPHLMQDSSLPLFHQPPSPNLQHWLLHHCDHGLTRCYRSECGSIPGLISCTLQE